jgi:hypothetical protein
MGQLCVILVRSQVVVGDRGVANLDRDAAVAIRADPIARDDACEAAGEFDAGA